MGRTLSFKAARGWRRVMLVFAICWSGLVVANAIIYPGGIKRAFIERRAYSELPLAGEAAVAREMRSQREDSRSSCLPGTISSSLNQEMKPGPIQIWEPPGQPPVDPYGGRPVLTSIVRTECVTYELLAAHGFWSAAILLGILMTALVGSWISRGFEKRTDLDPV